MKYKNRIFTVIAASFLLFSFTAKAQWDIPGDAKGQKSSFEASVETIMKGKEIFYKNCSSCHGDPGMGNVVPLTPPPTDLGSEDFLSKRADGEIFYQVTEGMGTMPSFKASLSDDERWQVVHFIRSHSAESSVDLSAQAKQLDIKVELIEDGHKVKAVVTENDTAVSDVKVYFGVKTHFTGAYDDIVLGNKVKTVIEPFKFAEVATDAKGIAVAEFPTDLPGRDTLGTSDLVIKFSNKDLYGDALVEESVTWAKPFHYKNPLDENHMWAPRANTPTWLLITYLSVVGGVWLTIGWVIFQLVRIHIYGKWH